MPDLSIKNVKSAYHGQAVLKDISLHLKSGEIGCLLGPSGCGKTTLLMSIAGFQPIEQGEICFSDVCIATRHYQLDPEHRDIGMVFQDYALFPHLTIYQNIAFGINKLSRKAQSQRIQELLNLVGLPDLAQRYPHELSGGQQQRIALARALAPKPKILLLDEPFSGLDIELRESLAFELRNILKAEGITALMVTHNQNEAFALADSVGVIKDGQLLQWDTPYNLYHKPAHPFVADFIGQGVLISGLVCDCHQVHTELGLLNARLPATSQTGDHVAVLVRPDDILHDDDSQWQLEVVHRAFRGSHFLFTLKLENGERVLCMSQSHHDHKVGSKIGIKLEMDHAIVFAIGDNMVCETVTA